jgi:chemotaxis protein methyltransferase CheR
MDAEMTSRPREDSFDYELRLLLEAIYHRYQHDFRHYAIASLRRRVTQAMQRFGCRSVSQLQDRILHEPDVFAQTLEYLTVQVSELFRDPAYFRALRQEVVPFLKTFPSVKLWVAGCSAGEEVISIAILLHEENLLDRALVYATDINPKALGAAKAGMYPIDRIAQFSENYLAAGGTRSLSDYYHAAYGSAIFDRALRQRVLYADHSLATDSVFSEVHFVSCRNVLIYFDRSLQDRSLSLFHDALVHRGYLGLGAKESLHFSALASSFVEVPGRQRIYRKV